MDSKISRLLIVIAVASSFLIPIVMIPRSYGAVSATLNISDTCGITASTLGFGTMAINSLSTFSTSNTKLNMTNTGSTVGTISVSGGNWLDGSSVAHLPAGDTVYAIPTTAHPTLTGSTASVSTNVDPSTGVLTSTFNAGNMTALTGSSTSIGTIRAQTVNETYWQVATVPGGGVSWSSSFNGALTQTITVTASC